MRIKKVLLTFDKKMLIGLVLMILGFTTIFLSGSLNRGTECEKIGHYASQVVNENTINKKYCTLSVEATNDSGPILNHHSEFYHLYGAFRQTKITFASMVNLYRDYDIRMDKIESENLSIFYLGPDGYENYNGHFKHYIYPFEFMFSGSSTTSSYLAYISKSHAKQLLISKYGFQASDGDFSEADYKSLLGKDIPISINGEMSTFVIHNIYLETNYYYEGIKEIAGDFILCSYNLPNGIISNLKNIYFLSEYDYQNTYFMNHINNSYSNHKYIVKVNHNNIIGKINDSYLISFYKEAELTDSFSYVLAAISAFLLFGSITIFVTRKKALRSLGVFLLITTSVSPYIVFSLIYKFTGDITFFSGFSTKINTFSLLSFYFLYFLVYYLRSQKKIYNSVGEINEIVI